MTTKRTIIINADDVGMHPSIDTAVMRLNELGIVTSASMMALGRPDADAMRGFSRYGMDIGLHLDFTSGMAAQRYGASTSVGLTLAQIHAGRLSKQQARTIVKDQLQRFCDLVGAAPVFIDGHEHVHQFPVIRDALMEVIGEEGICERPFIRNTRPRQWRGIKAVVIGLLGARALEKKIGDTGCLCNTDFFGVYDLKKEVRLDRLWHGWLQAMPVQGALVMCHPALAAVSADEAFRLREYRFLSSGLFEEMLYQYNTTTAGWKAVVGDVAV